MRQRNKKAIIAGMAVLITAIVLASCAGHGPPPASQTTDGTISKQQERESSTQAEPAGSQAPTADFRITSGSQESAFAPIEPTSCSEPQTDYGSQYIKIVYDDPDAEQAFPSDVYKQAAEMAQTVAREFTPVEGDGTIPQTLLTAAEKALYERMPHELTLPLERPVTEPEAFYESFQEPVMDDEYRLCSMYCYCLEGQNYYLLVKDYGGSGLYSWIHVFRETEGRLEWLSERMSLDHSAEVIEYEGAFYLLEGTYNYNSKCRDGLLLYTLTENGIGKGTEISREPAAYHYKRIYTDSGSQKEEITEYLETIWDDLMKASVLSHEFCYYTGDERPVTDPDINAKLTSLNRSARFWQIDFNNDGVLEYILKEMFFPSNYLTMGLNTAPYRLTTECAAELGRPFYNDDFELCQLWFKKFQGKTLTFRLFYWDDKYLLNICLIEKSHISQLQTWLIVPENELRLEPLAEEQPVRYGR